MSNIQPKKQDLDGVEYLSLDEATKITISGDDSSSNGARIELGKDLTTAPIISHLSGSGFDFGVLGDFTFPQMILSKEKLQAVVTPLPATDTLKINKKVLLDDGTNTGTLDINGTDLEISSSGNQLLGGVITIDTTNNRVGINVPVPTEDFEIDGNIQLDTGSFSKIVFYDKPNNHEHGEIDAGGEGTNGGRIRFQTKVDGGSVTEKLRITANGRIGLGGANYGTAGQVLTSNGASAPTWTTPASSANKVINDQTASYTLVATDNNKRVIMDSATDTDITINNSVFVAGDSVFIANKGTGTTTIVEGAGVSIGSSSGKEMEQYRSALLLAFSPTNFSLFLSAGRVPLNAIGGTTAVVIISGVSYKTHTYDVVGTFSFDVIAGSGEVEYLVVAGGGGAGNYYSGGGGGGGYRSSVVGEASGGGASAEAKLSVVTGSYSVVVGNGGAGSSGTAGSGSVGGKGGNSSFSTIVSEGGGGGASRLVGGSGGSGGGGGNANSAGGSGASNEGFSGGNGSGTGGASDICGGGGGGASAGGINGVFNSVRGDGGNGIQSNINGTPTYYSGGGGGASSGAFGNNLAGIGGLGGGGAGGGSGGGSLSTQGVAGLPNTGGGAGGDGERQSVTASAGGSGIVIVRYPI